MAGYRIRDETLDDDTTVVVRGGLLEIGSLRRDAVAARVRFGQYGISVFAAADESAVDSIARDRLNRFDVLTVMSLGDLRRSGLDVVPTFRRPHCTLMLPDLEADLRRLLQCENVVWVNPHFEPPGVPP